MIFAAGLSYKYLIAALMVFAVFVPVFWYFKESFLSAHQINRFLVFFDPYRDPTGAGYNVIQSEISIGSGQFAGKGFLQGSQNQLEYLPAKHTDFIFATIGEEWGFVGAIVVVILLTLIIMRCLAVARRAHNDFGYFICIGIASMFAFHMIENIGMCLQLMPVTGRPLPFFSYGGSSIITLFAAMGIVSGVRKRMLPEWLRN